MAELETTPRQSFKFSFRTLEGDKVTYKMYDRINVDDVFLHLVNRELYLIVTGKNTGNYIPPIYRDALLRERFLVGQD